MDKNDRQSPLWNEDFLSALDDVIRARGTYQQVAGELWPSLKTGYNKLKNKLNPDHHEHFHPEEIVQLMRIGREIGCHAAIYHLCDDIGYERPSPSSAKSEETLLAEKVAASAAEHARLCRELDRARAKSTTTVRKLTP